MRNFVVRIGIHQVDSPAEVAHERNVCHDGRQVGDQPGLVDDRRCGVGGEERQEVGGLGLVPLMIGMFAVSEIIRYTVDTAQVALAELLDRCLPQD